MSTTASHTLRLTAPLDASWDEQLCYLWIPLADEGLVNATCDGAAWPCQATGRRDARGREVAIRLGFARGQQRTLTFIATAAPMPPAQEVPFTDNVVIGDRGLPITLASPTIGVASPIRGPFARIGDRPIDSTFSCRWPLRTATLRRLASGPLFEDWEIRYACGDEARSWTLQLRCHRSEPIVEVHERIDLGMDAAWSMRLNPQGVFERFLRDSSFEGDDQPLVFPLVAERPKDVLFRLQMPVLTEYFIPNNGGWFALLPTAGAAQEQLGVLGLHGGQWRRAVENVVTLLGDGGRVHWKASLNGGERHWLLHRGPVETAYIPEGRLAFHRLHGQCNACRLDEHLDLDGVQVFDREHEHSDGIFAGDWRARARTNAQQLEPLRRFLEQNSADQRSTTGGVAQVGLPVRAVLTGDRVLLDRLKTTLFERFARWVRQFQGWRSGQNDYAKNVIGFSRCLRGLMISYELLRKDGALDEREVGLANSYFAFAARRILDAGRWPHAWTWLHPDHPDSTRDFYTYPGEHKPDRLVWTNCLPNFQNDPLSALAHLSCLIPGHPDARRWRRFALDDLDRQLDAYIGESGGHEESINYALYTFSYFTITFRMLKHRTGIDYFQDERLRRCAAWLVRILAPYDPRFDAVQWPALGNSVALQNQAEYLLVFADHLAATDPLREQCIAAYRACAPRIQLGEHYPLMMAVAAPIPRGDETMAVHASEVMDEVGVALRHRQRQPDESLLLQKIGFAKDHYEGDESSFNWYAKGKPFAVDYGTYTGDAGRPSAHNLVEIPDMDNLRRGYLAAHHFTAAVDYTRCEMPITLKLSHGRVRSFADIDGPPQKPLFFYIGDENPVGPKTWVTRQLLWGKPDWIALFDRVHGAVPHRWNLHHTADRIVVDGRRLQAHGRHGLDLEGFIQHPAPADLQVAQGELCPGPDRYGAGAANLHRQAFVRLANQADGTYRVLLFAREPGRAVTIRALGAVGIVVETPEYTDIVFLSDTDVEEHVADPAFGQVRFHGRAGWIRRSAAGFVSAVVSDGEMISAFGTELDGRGPWAWNLDGTGRTEVTGTPRPLRVGQGA